MTVEWRQLKRAKLTCACQAELERISVFRIQLRISDEDVLHVEECRERVELLRARPANATRVRNLCLSQVAELVECDRAREKARVAVRILRGRILEREVTISILRTQAALQIEIARALA